uniref:Uncharacterized protein n=1 Tax=Uncultured archaeon GZfos26G2 TaxID=3386331 RepID=Q648H0_UNCAG|nr:hypothetical protein GZ37D1_54 [uncultured archaeon GZfos37D1]
MVKCQNCTQLEKIPYSQARPTHHENWHCKINGWTLAYPFTVVEIKCPSYKKKEAKL